MFQILLVRKPGGGGGCWGEALGWTAILLYVRPVAYACEHNIFYNTRTFCTPRHTHMLVMFAFLRLPNQPDLQQHLQAPDETTSTSSRPRTCAPSETSAGFSTGSCRPSPRPSPTRCTCLSRSTCMQDWSKPPGEPGNLLFKGFFLGVFRTDFYYKFV